MKELMSRIMEAEDIFKPASDEDVTKRADARFPLTQDIIDILVNTSNAVIDALTDTPDGDDTQEIAERFLLELDYAAGNTSQVEYLDMLSDYANRPVEEAHEDIFAPASKEDMVARDKVKTQQFLKNAGVSSIEELMADPAKVRKYGTTWELLDAMKAAGIVESVYTGNANLALIKFVARAVKMGMDVYYQGIPKYYKTNYKMVAGKEVPEAYLKALKLKKLKYD